MKQHSFAADRELIQALEKRSQPVPCQEGCVLFSQGEAPKGVYIIESGEAYLMLESESGGAVMCLQADAGSLLGLPGIVGNKPYTMTAMAHKGSNVRFVARNDFEDITRTEPSLYPMVLRVLAAEIRTARQVLSGN